ncbi:hypothetical protein PanWU01x14_348050 [Parasponia andersonii]|uniref:Uncharacterized protein n=1 Tax=Parasponia andersonii TaxID=3476 RepID=A0A2P5ABT7_PARAD|nr:hypothetical protein PanWU01x14_348050 [Parasponia andersonii]
MFYDFLDDKLPFILNLPKLDHLLPAFSTSNVRIDMTCYTWIAISSRRRKIQGLSGQFKEDVMGRSLTSI